MSIRTHARLLADSTERMIGLQMSAYPDSWSAEDRREMASRHLFGERTPAKGETR